MATTAGKKYIKHPKTALAEVFKISTDYAHNALKTLGKDKVLDTELREKVQKVIEEKLPNDEFKTFRQLIELHYTQGKSVEEAAKLLNVSIPQAYGWLTDIKLMIADQLYLFKILAETYKTELIERLKRDPEMIVAVSKANNLKPVTKRGHKSKAINTNYCNL